MEAVVSHERQLTAHAYEVLESIEGVRVLGPGPDQRLPVFSFTVRGIPPYDVARLLDRQGIAVRSGHHCTMPLHRRFGLTTTVRASFALYNTLAEIDHWAQRFGKQGGCFAANREPGCDAKLRQRYDAAEGNYHEKSIATAQPAGTSGPLDPGVRAGRSKLRRRGLPTIMRRAGWTRSRPGGRWSCWQVRRGAGRAGRSGS